MRQRTGHYPPRLVPASPAQAAAASGDALEAPETCIGEEAIAQELKIPVERLAELRRKLRGRPNRPPIRNLSGVLVAEKAKIVAWWQQQLRAQHTR